MTGTKTFRVLVLISGNGSNLQALIDKLNPARCQIVAVISNKADAFGLQRAQQAGIATQVVDHTAYDSREHFDTALAQVIDDYSPDLIVMAGFMRILTDAFVQHFPGRMINIHPSLLPKFKGLNTHQRALDAGEKHHGVSVHYVTLDLDGGPLIAQAALPISEDDSASTLAQKVQQLEHQLLPQVVSAIATGQISLSDAGPCFEGAPLDLPLRLNQGKLGVQ